VETFDESCAATVTAQAGAPPSAPATTLRVAYLLSQYPAISHTFFLQEVLGLRARGLHIETASINRADRPLNKLPTQEAVESLSTFYVKNRGKANTLRLLLSTVFAQPRVVLRGLKAILRLPGLTLWNRGFWLLYLAEALMIGRWMETRRLSHLHVHFGGSVASVAMLVSTAWEIPYSMTIHGPEELLDIAAYHLREKVAQASFVLCISDFCRSQLCQITAAASWGKFHVNRLGVDPSILTPSQRAPESTRSASGVLELVCIGRLVPVATARGAAACNTDWRWLRAKRS
jgi:colanic acid/amylovoran biosynthesis glycosyltransferase